MNLYKIETMKIQLSVYLWAALGIFVSLLALGMLYLFLGNMGEEIELFADWNGLLALNTAIAFACFGIFSAVIAAKVIVSEYCGKNIVVLFSYPISRRKILNTKCMIVCCITIIFAFVSNMSVMGVMYITSKIFNIVPQLTTRYFIPSILLTSFLMGILSSALGIISATVGLKKHSTIATIICSVLIVCFVTNFIVFSPRNIVLVMMIMIVFFIMAVGVMYHILANGIEKMEV